MSKTLKKALSLLLFSTFLFSFAGVAADETVPEDKAIFNVKGIGLMQGYEDGSFREDKDLTRAEMTVIVGRILQVNEDTRCNTEFGDVTEEHWASGVIAALTDIGIVKGMGDGTFMPDKSVTFNQTVKLIVAALGYGDIAEQLGGYPAGYVTEAANLRLLRGVDSQERIITRGDTAKILYNAFDVKPMIANYNKEQHVSDKTLYETLTDEREVMKYSGILMETENTSIISKEPSVKEGHVILRDKTYGDKKLPCDFSMDRYIGCDLNVYVYMEDGEPREIKNVSLTNNDETYEYDAEVVRWSGGSAKIEKDDNKKDETKKLSADVKVLYNGRLSNMDPTFRKIEYGSYKFLDNSGDGIADVLFINEAQSFIVDRVNAAKSTVYFKNNVSLSGKRALVLDEEDDSKSIVLLDKDGNPITVEDIEENNGITVFASEDFKYIKAIVCDEAAEGVINEISGDEVWIDGEKYKIAKKTDGALTFKPGTGDEGTYILDCFGNIIDSDGTVSGDYLYAYVISAGREEEGISDELQLKTITGLAPEKEVVKSGEDDVIYYYFQNDLVKIYECANNVKVDGVRRKVSAINPVDLEKCMIAFNLNSEGKIKEINTYDVSTSPFLQHTFNARVLTFGGEGLTRGWATDDNTVFICIPESGSRETDDYYVQVKIQDKSEANKVFGNVFFPDASYADANAEPVDILLIKAAMDSSSAPVPSATDDICIIGNVILSEGTIHDDVGSEVYKLEMLNGTKVIQLPTASGGEAYDVASTLRKGDLLRYVKDGFGRIAGIKKLCSVQGLGDNYSSNIIMNSGFENGMYGLIYDVQLDTYDSYENDYIDKIMLSFAPDGSDSDVSAWLRVPKLDGPPVYLYERSTGWISPGDLNDVTASAYAGSDASKAFVLTASNEVSAIVIIED